MITVSLVGMNAGPEKGWDYTLVDLPSIPAVGTKIVLRGRLFLVSEVEIRVAVAKEARSGLVDDVTVNLTEIAPHGFGLGPSPLDEAMATDPGCGVRPDQMPLLQERQG